jgi:hypothetical protein
MKIEVKVEVEVETDFLQNYNYLCIPIKRNVKHDKNNFP